MTITNKIRVYFKVLPNDKRTKADDTYPIAVRVTYQRNNTTFNTGIRVKSHLWDTGSLNVKSSYPNAQAYNKTISDFYSKVQNIAFHLVNEGKFIFETLKERLNETIPMLKKVSRVCFKEHAEQLVKDMLTVNQAGNAILYRTTINRFMKYADNPSLKFTEIDYNKLKGFKRHLIKGGVK